MLVDARHVDDHAAFVSHRARSLLRGQERGAYVDCKRAVEVLSSELQHRLRGRQPRVVDEDVEAAELLGHLAHEPLRHVRLGEITPDPLRGAVAQLLEGAATLVVVIARGEADRVALLLQPFGDRKTDALAGARHERDAARLGQR